MTASHRDTMSNEDAPAMPTSAPDRSGEWIVPEVSYVDPSRRFCAYCGRPIARRYWRERTPAGDLAFCGPEHAAIHAGGDAGAPAPIPPAGAPPAG